MQLTGDAQAKDNDRFGGEDVDLTLRVQTGRQYLDQRRGPAVDGIREGEDMARWSRHIFGKAAIGIATDQHAVRTQVGLPDPAMETGAAVQLRVDDDPLAGGEAAGVAPIDNPADHFVSHDPGIADRNRAAVDLEIRPADSAVRHADQHPAGVLSRARHLVGHQLARCFQDHGFHRIHASATATNS